MGIAGNSRKIMIYKCFKCKLIIENGCILKQGRKIFYYHYNCLPINNKFDGGYFINDAEVIKND